MKMEDGYRRPDDGKGGLGEGFEHGKIDLPKGAIHYLDGLSPSQIDEEFDEKIKNQDESLKEKIEKFYEEAKEIVQKSMIEKGKTYETHKAETGDSRNGEISENRNKELTEEEKAKIKEETGWSDEVINAIGSMEEYEIYKKAGLVEVKVGDKVCLVKTDIDWNRKDEMGRSNKERAEQGLAPLDNNGKPIELHHIGQKPDAPLAELTNEEHHSNGNDTILHDKSKSSEIDRAAFTIERADHWFERSQMEDNEK